MLDLCVESALTNVDDGALWWFEIGASESCATKKRSSNTNFGPHCHRGRGRREREGERCEYVGSERESVTGQFPTHLFRK